jgi:hypothetical protein
MEKLSGSGKKSGKRTIPLWLVLVLCGIILIMFAIIILLMLYTNSNRSDPVSALPSGTVSAEIDPAKTPDHQEIQPGSTEPEVTAGPTAEPTAVPTAEPTAVPTAEPTAEPTKEPTPEPTAEPTKEPTAKPTSKPDSFLFGGKKVKTGATKVNGKSLGINGKKNKLKHITEKEVEDLVNLCPDLEELNLDYCYMDDYTPLGKLVKLRKLHLTSCGVGQGNAIEDISWLENLTQLRTLDLAHNNISDTEVLAGLTRLTFLNIGDNPLTDEDLVPIGELTNLNTLYLYDLKRIEDVEPLSNLSKLTFLHIGYNSKLKDVKPLTALKKLEYLRLHHTKVSSLSDFGKLTSLKKLDLGKCPIKSSTVPNLKGCTKLETIVLEMGDMDLYNAVLELINEGYPLHFSYNWSDD